jgi:sugar phosphate isomerase/epimerase
MTTQIGAQLYTVREHTKTPADIARTLQRIKALGYGAVQISAFGEIDNKELAKLLKDQGLVCAATHYRLDAMGTQACIDYHQAIGCKYTAIGGFFPWRGGATVTADTWVKFADEFNPVATKLAEYGIRVGYHNHSHELVHFDGRTGLDILLEKLDPSVWFEIDTYWIAHGAGDPAAWIDKVAASAAKGGPNRIPAIHVKDMTIAADAQGQRVQKMCEVGSGNLNWPRILEACRKANVEWYLVERDDGDLDPFDSLKISLDNMKRMGLR